MENLDDNKISELIEVYEQSEKNLETMEELSLEIKKYLNNENFNEKYIEIKTMFEKMNVYIKENETTKNELKQHIEILTNYKTIISKVEKGMGNIETILDNKIKTFEKVEKILSASIPFFGFNVLTTLLIVLELWKVFK